jgi:flagellar motor switch protein FliN/FliY
MADAAENTATSPDFDNALKDGAEAGDAVEEVGGRLARTDFSKLKMILDVPLKVSVELGRTKMLINDLLQLGQGSVIELDKIAGEPMEILINDKLVAMGEVVVVNEKFGVRLTDVVSQFGLNDLQQSKEA